MIRREKTEMSDAKRLTAFVDRALEAQKVRHPLRCTGRLLNLLSFKRFGIPSGGGWKRLDAKDSGTDTKLLMDVLWSAYWPALPDIAQLCENGLELPEEPEKDEFIETPQLESGRPEYIPSMLLLPPPSAPVFIPEVEAEVIPPEPLPVIDEEELAREAEETANQALSVFQGDHALWEDPQRLLADTEATLVAVSPHHPDKESLYERLAFVRDCHRHLDKFREDFDHLMNTSLNPDDVWDVPWLAGGAQNLLERQAMPTPDNLRRASLPHYLVEKWKSAVTQDRDPTGERPVPSANANATTDRSFRGPASVSDNGF